MGVLEPCSAFAFFFYCSFDAVAIIAFVFWPPGLSYQRPVFSSLNLCHICISLFSRKYTALLAGSMSRLCRKRHCLSALDRGISQIWNMKMPTICQYNSVAYQIIPFHKKYNTINRKLLLIAREFSGVTACQWFNGHVR